MGAWIETLSHDGQSCRDNKSHPMWVRGLKQKTLQNFPANRQVAPYVGAWIETLHKGMACRTVPVAPYVGAWIETSTIVLSAVIPLVAPYVGAWIETDGRACRTW